MTESKSTNQIPGPGSYSTRDEFGKNSRGVSIMGKNNLEARNDSPGPGQYDPQTNVIKDSIQSATMGGSKRQNYVQ